MVTKIVISPEDDRKIIRKNLIDSVPPRQVHRNKKAYLRKVKHKKQEDD